MGLLSLRDLEGHDPTGWAFGDLLVVCGVATEKYEEEKYRKQWKPPVASPKRKIMGSLIEAQRSTGRRNGLKRIYVDPDFKISQNKSKSKNKEPGMRSDKRPKLDVPAVPNPPPDLPEDLKNRIKAVGGTEVVMVIQKRLTDTDLQEGHNRLSMPFGKIDRGFLREEEKDLLAEQQIMEVPFLEPSREVSKMILRQWDMGKKSGKTSSMYVLRTNWNDAAKKNVLKANDVVQVWSFRVGGEQQQLLGLALVVVSRSSTKS